MKIRKKFIKTLLFKKISVKDVLIFYHLFEIILNFVLFQAAEFCGIKISTA